MSSPQSQYLIDALLPHLASPRATPFNLSTTLKLKRLMFVWIHQPGVPLIVDTLQTVESKNLQDIALQPAMLYGLEGSVRQEWQNLDRLLVQFWTSHSIRPKLMYKVWMGRDVRDYASRALPGLARRGLTDLVEFSH